MVRSRRSGSAMSSAIVCATGFRCNHSMRNAKPAMRSTRSTSQMSCRIARARLVIRNTRARPRCEPWRALSAPLATPTRALCKHRPLKVPSCPRQLSRFIQFDRCRERSNCPVRRAVSQTRSHRFGRIIRSSSSNASMHATPTCCDLIINVIMRLIFHC